MESIDAETAKHVDPQLLASLRASYAASDVKRSDKPFEDFYESSRMHGSSSTWRVGPEAAPVRRVGDSESESARFSLSTGVPPADDGNTEAKVLLDYDDTKTSARLHQALAIADDEVRAQIAARLKVEAENRTMRGELAVALRRLRSAEAATEAAEGERARAVAAGVSLQERLAAVRSTQEAAVRSAAQAEQRAAAATTEAEGLRTAVAAASRLPAQLQATRDQLAAAQARAAAADSLRLEVESLKKDRATLQRQVEKASARVLEHEGEVIGCL